MNLYNSRRRIRQAISNCPTIETRHSENGGQFLGTLTQIRPGILSGCWSGLKVSAVLDIKSMKYRLFAFSQGHSR
jgi:hypothetical protein